MRAAAYSSAWSDPRRSILVAEDDPELRRILVETLESEGHDVEAVASGAALVIELSRRTSLQRPCVDLVVSDVRMPTCSGLEAVEMVRRFYGDVPVLLLTAFSDEATRTRASELAATLLDKPVSMRALRGVVAGLLRRRHVSGPTERS
jgi:DNA-binding response OmpR family regulator